MVIKNVSFKKTNFLSLTCDLQFQIKLDISETTHNKLKVNKTNSKIPQTQGLDFKGFALVIECELEYRYDMVRSMYFFILYRKISPLTSNWKT